jgi:hypothetical protein
MITGGTLTILGCIFVSTLIQLYLVRKVRNNSTLGHHRIVNAKKDS